MLVLIAFLACWGASWLFTVAWVHAYATEHPM